MTIADQPARRAIHSVSARLNADGQIANLPEPAAVLGALCAHHLLERLDYSPVAFRFQHQQFQEFYAANLLRRELQALGGKPDRERDKSFITKYVNRPVWEEPLRMLAEEIGEASTGPSAPDSILAGARLIDLALQVDPVFAAELSRLSGAVVWKSVREHVAARLRAWYRNPDSHHQECALTGMVASGSEDFRDILLPLLSSHDRQVRMKAYGTWRAFHLPSLGTDWAEVVEGWDEEQRVDFINIAIRGRQTAHIAEKFTLADPSPSVRLAALRSIEFAGDRESLTSVLGALSDKAFDEVLQQGVWISPGLRPRALAAYERILAGTKNPGARLGILLAATKIGLDCASQRLKDELVGWPAGNLPGNNHPLKPALEIIGKTDSLWVGSWLVDRILQGSLWGDHWRKLISHISRPQRQQLLDHIAAQPVDPPDVLRIASVFAAAADPDLCADLFTRICRLRASISNTADEIKRAQSHLLWQLKQVFWKLPPEVAVPGILLSLSAEFDPIEYHAAIDCFGSGGFEGADPKAETPDEPRQSFRKYLKDGLTFTLQEQDFSGELKASLATALARIGAPEDVIDIHTLIRADLERVRKGRSARLRGERTPPAEGAVVAWTNWYVRALAVLDSQQAEAVLLQLLHEPEYERDVSAALVRLAKTQTSASDPLSRSQRTRLPPCVGRSGRTASDRFRRAPPPNLFSRYRGTYLCAHEGAFDKPAT